jgi:hypothetical protein
MLQPESKKGPGLEQKFTLVDFIRILEVKLRFLKVKARSRAL